MSRAVRARTLSAEETQAFAAARLVAIELAPYLAHGLFAMAPVAAEGLGTMAVDARWRCYVDPAALTEWGPQVGGGVLVHEVSHLLRDHAGRAAPLGPDLDHATWNIATDAAINDDLLAAGIPLPENVVTPAGLDLPADGIEESYYAQLRQTLSASEIADEPGCGSGAGDPAAVWELPDDAPAAPGLSPTEGAMTRRAVAEAVRGTAPGTVPGRLRRWADDALTAPTVPWRRVLGSSVRRAIGWARGRTDYTYSRPGRRRQAGVLMPAMRQPLVSVAVLIDTSASMSSAQLTAALTEVTGVIRAAGIGPRGLAVLTCDAEVTSAVQVRAPGSIELHGGGGTDLRVGITAAEGRRPAPDVLVVLTDGYTPWPDRPTRARLIVGLTGDAADPDSVPSWASAVTIPAAA